MQVDKGNTKLQLPADTKLRLAEFSLLCWIISSVVLLYFDGHNIVKHYNKTFGLAIIS